MDVMKYESDNSTFVWKHPQEGFHTSSQLIVHESQEAISFLNGQAPDLFGPGRYTLETQNIPLLKNIINLPTAGQSPFYCEVYFINKAEQMAIKWGTDSKVQYVDPPISSPSPSGLVTFFRGILMARVKTYMAQTMRANAINIFEVDERLEEFSSHLKERLVADFLDYGVQLQQFFVTTVAWPDGDPSMSGSRSFISANTPTLPKLSFNNGWASLRRRLRPSGWWWNPRPLPRSACRRAIPTSRSGVST